LPRAVSELARRYFTVRAKREDKKQRPDTSQAMTPRERELLALFRVMTETDRRLLLFTAGKMISAEVRRNSRTT